MGREGAAAARTLWSGAAGAGTGPDTGGSGANVGEAAGAALTDAADPAGVAHAKVDRPVVGRWSPAAASGRPQRMQNRPSFGVAHVGHTQVGSLTVILLGTYAAIPPAVAAPAPVVNKHDKALREPRSGGAIRRVSPGRGPDLRVATAQREDLNHH